MMAIPQNMVRIGNLTHPHLHQLNSSDKTRVWDLESGNHGLYASSKMIGLLCIYILYIYNYV